MCGIIYASSFTDRPVNKKIIKQFNRQMSRGVEGFGIYDGDYQNIVRTPHKRKAVRWLKRYPSKDILFHHRYPTSTDNVKNACHPFSTGDAFDTQYILVHNGVISNDDDLKTEHDKLGIRYSSMQRDGRYNDSEALLWDFALYMEGKQDTLKAQGSIAFICVAIKNGHRTLYFGRNSGSPLNMLATAEHLMLSSEGSGISIETNKLYKFDYDTQELSKSDLTINGYSYSSYSYSGYYGGSGYATPYDRYNSEEFEDDYYDPLYAQKYSTDAKNIAEAYLEITNDDVKDAMDMLEADMATGYYEHTTSYLEALDDAYSLLIERSMTPEYSIVQQHLKLMEERR